MLVYITCRIKGREGQEERGYGGGGDHVILIHTLGTTQNYEIGRNTESEPDPEISF